MALINCPSCGKKISEKALACPGCGYAFSELHKSEEPKSIICEECGAEIFQNEAVCPHCGCPINQREKQSEHAGYPLYQAEKDNIAASNKQQVKSKKRNIFVVVGFAVVVLLVVGAFYFKSNSCNASEQIVVDCGKYLQSTLKDPGSLQLLENPIMCCYDDPVYEHPYTYIILTYSATNSYGGRVSNHAYFYVEPDKSSWKCIGDDSDYENAPNRINQELSMLKYMLRDNTPPTYNENFKVDKIAKHIGCST